MLRNLSELMYGWINVTWLSDSKYHAFSFSASFFCVTPDPHGCFASEISADACSGVGCVAALFRGTSCFPVTCSSVPTISWTTKWPQGSKDCSSPS